MEPRYQLFISSGTTYALHQSTLGELYHVSKITDVPHAPPHMIGTTNLGDMVSVFDFRAITGEKTLEQELAGRINFLNERKKDHEKWVGVVANDLSQGRLITAQTDPHKCAFGVLYDARDKTNRQVERIMSRFDFPHKVAHRLIGPMNNYIQAGNILGARKLFEEAQNENGAIYRLLGLFDSASKELTDIKKRVLTFKTREEDRSLTGLLVDEFGAFTTFERIEPKSKLDKTAINTNMILGAGFTYQEPDRIVWILDPAKIIQ